jgi:hypothetical protein
MKTNFEDTTGKVIVNPLANSAIKIAIIDTMSKLGLFTYRTYFMNDGWVIIYDQNL